MPTVTLNRKEFEKLVGKKLPEEKLKDRISMLGTDLESVSKDEIIVEIFPNRPDMLSEQGFARAFSSFIGVKKGLVDYKVDKSGLKVIVDKSVKDIRPFTACAIVKGIKFDNDKIKEIIQIQEKLHVTFGRNRKKLAIGVYPLEKIKFPITYKAKKPNEIKFKPLESEREMTGLQILSQHKTGREFGHLLEGKKLFPIFEDADGQILSMPPIINSHDVGKVSSKTTDVFVECSGFDFRVLNQCLNIVVTAMADMGGKVFSLELDYHKKEVTPNLQPWKLKFDLKYVNDRLGLELKEKEVVDLLNKMGYGFEKGDVLVPAYRTDILHQIDLIEDIAIAYGYENFDAIIPNVATIGAEDEFEKFKNKVANILVGLGLLEVKNYHLISKEELDAMNIDYPAVKLKSSVSQGYDHLRNWIIPSLMNTLKINRNHEYPQEIFEIGTCFKLGDGVEEFDRLGVVKCAEDSDFTRIKQVLDYLMRMLDVEYSMIETEHGSFISGRVARVSVKGKEVAYIGEISPQVLENFGITVPVSAFELNLTELFKLY